MLHLPMEEEEEEEEEEYGPHLSREWLGQAPPSGAAPALRASSSQPIDTIGSPRRFAREKFPSCPFLGQEEVQEEQEQDREPQEKQEEGEEEGE